MKSRYKIAKRVLIFWCLFVGLGAVWGSACMLLDPSGLRFYMDGLLPGMQVLPFAEVLFRDLLFPGIALLIVNGLTNLTAAFLMLRGKKAGVTLGTVFGVTLMLWICIQFFIYPLNFLSLAYFIFGLCQFIAGYCACVFYRQESFPFRAEDYTNIGTNPSRLVVYFSRMGYTRKLAYEAADKTGAELLELKATEPTAGTAGFWWCGRFAMHRWAMPIEPPTVDLSSYEQVTVCSPVWVFSVASPVRAFCELASGKLKSADYILCHHMKSDFARVADEMDGILGTERTNLYSVCCRKGRYINK